MKISFDLDGTICDSDWGWLDRLRDTGWKGEEKYYACREKILDPYRFLARGDEFIIVTGRPIHLKEVTIEWLKKNGLGHIEVIFTKTIKDKPTATKKEFEKLGKAKARILISHGVDIHFDDNEQVVNALRECSEDKFKVIQVGHHIMW